MSSEQYEALAPFYRPLAKAREHFEMECSLVCSFLSRLRVGKEAHILDAACGTGDVVDLLHKAGYSNTRGIDGSATMISQASSLTHLSPFSLSICNWSELRNWWNRNGKYDLVFLLGNSIAHAEAPQIPSILKCVHAGLRNGGIFCVDQRNWSMDKEGVLRDSKPERRIPTLRDLTKGRPIQVGGKTFEVHDLCEHMDNIQKVTYRVRELTTLGEEPGWQMWCELSYSVFPLSTMRAWLVEAGFRDVQEWVTAPEEWSYREPWPYAVLVARKAD